MGVLIDEPKSLIMTVTRKSWARGLHARDWGSLVREAASSLTGKFTDERLEEEVCATVLRILLEDTVGAGSCLGPLILDYIRFSVTGAPNIVDPENGKPFIRPGYMARSIVLLKNRPSWALQAVMQILAPAIADGQSLSPAALYLCSGLEDFCDGLTTLESEIGNCEKLESILDVIRYSEALLKSPPFPFISGGLSHSTTLELLDGVHLSQARLKSAKSNNVNAQTLFHSHIKQLESLQSLLQPKSIKILKSDKSLDDFTETADPDVHFLVSDLLNYCTLPSGASNTEGAVARMVALLIHRISNPEARGGSRASAFESFLLEIWLASMGDLQKVGGNTAANRSFLYSRMPELLSGTLSQIKQDSLFSSVETQNSLINALRRLIATVERKEVDQRDAIQPEPDSMAVDEVPSGETTDLLIAALCRQDLLSVAAAKSLSPTFDADSLSADPESFTADPSVAISQSIENGDYDTAKSVLRMLLIDHAVTRAITDDVLTATQACVKKHGLDATASLCSILLDNPDVLEVVFLHSPPSHLLSPICSFLETFDSSSERYSEEHAIEHYGAVVLFLEVVLTRRSLHDDLPRHLGSVDGFFTLWLPSVSAVYSLSSLDEVTKTAVNGWVGGLFGEGISDELIHSTNPRILLRAAPTICKQALVACQAGVIDVDTLREGLSYFLQELLSFTLPGVLCWLISEISRVPPSPARDVLFEMFKIFVFSESLPSIVLELVAPDLAKLAERLSAAASPDVDLLKLKKLLQPWHVPSAQKGSRSSWQEQLRADVSAAVDAPKTIRPNLAVSLRSCLPEFASQQGTRLLSSLQQHLRGCSKSISTAEDEQAWLRTSRLVRVGTALLSVRDADAAKPPPLLYLWTVAGIKDVLRLVHIPSPDNSEAQAVLIMDAEMISAAFALSLELEVQRGYPRSDNQVSKILLRVVFQIQNAQKVRKPGGKLKATTSASALDFWLETFKSCKELQQVEGFVGLL